MLGTDSEKISAWKRPWLLAIAIIFFIFLAADAAGSVAIKKKYDGLIYPNILVGPIDVGKKTAEQARQLLNAEIDDLNQRGIIFSYQNRQVTITPSFASADADLVYPIINFDAEQTSARALKAGKSDFLLFVLPNYLFRLAVKTSLPAAVSINQAALEKNLNQNFADAIEPARDARLEAKYDAASGNYDFSVAEEKTGKTIDYETAVSQALENLGVFDNREIRLSTMTEYPKILKRDGLNIESKVQTWLKAAPLTLKYGDNKWIIERAALAELLGLKPGGLSEDKIRVGLDNDKFKSYSDKAIAPKVNQEREEAKFQIQNGKVSEFQNGRDGLEVDADATVAKIENEIFSGNEIELAVKTQPVMVNAGNINNYGIKEIIGVGTSNFSGSPANRRHNIKVGANSVNGTLIKPGEEFSLLKTLGEVASSTGYLPELVIKEGRTTPEFGGGLCQIGTTVFRGVIDSGLPVTMRRNHSYRVQYYEPAGTDATIYDPWPDFRFLNDTGNYILIQAKFSGDNLSFEFWGTRDGRLAEKTQSVIYNIVKPAPPKLIETLDLKPGQKKCTEKAHNGADAYFDYKVTYPNGEIKQKRFSSHYVPWQEVCLIGVEKLSPPPDNTASSTPAN